MKELNPEPDIPKSVLLDTNDETTIQPITTNFIDGEVNFTWTCSNDVVDSRFDILFDIISKQVNRFAIHHEQGEDFVIGWIYNIKNSNDTSIHIRYDISEIYSNDKYPSDPSKINNKYNSLNEF